MFAIIYKYESAAGEAIPMHKMVQNSRSIRSSEVLIVRFGFYGAAWNSIRPRTDLCIKLLFNDLVVQQPCIAWYLCFNLSLCFVFWLRETVGFESIDFDTGVSAYA